MDKKLIKKAEKLIKEFFKKTSFQVDCSFSQPTDDALAVDIKTDEPQILIGERGRTLAEFQTILAKILRKQLGESIYLNLDINQYKQNKEKYLEEMALSLADKVALEKVEHVLFPMSSYERRLIHTFLAERGDVKTESIGEEPDRRIVIKPA